MDREQESKGGKNNKRLITIGYTEEKRMKTMRNKLITRRSRKGIRREDVKRKRRMRTMRIKAKNRKKRRKENKEDEKGLRIRQNNKQEILQRSRKTHRDTSI